MIDPRPERISMAAEGERQRFLARASSVLSESLDMRETFQRVAALCVPALADWVTITVIEDEVLRRVAGVHRDPSKQPLVDRYREMFPPDRHRSDGPLSALAQGRSILFPRVDDAMIARASQGSEHEALIRALGCSSTMMVPMRARGRVVGVISFMRGEGAPLTESDLALAEDLAARAAFAIDNALLFRAEKRARDELEAALRSRDEFLSVAAHELQTPLTTLALQVGGLLRQLALHRELQPETLVRRLERADLQVERLETLIRQLLDVTRLHEGRMRLELEPVDLAALVREIVERFADLALARSSELELELPDALVVRCDRARIDQVVTNLLSNALKFGAGKPVAVSLVGEPDVAVVRVADRGLGIAPEDQRRIFERFERVASPNYGGFGIGLWLAKQIVDLHQGAITVESALGAGATFTLRIPAGSQGAEVAAGGGRTREERS